MLFYGINLWAFKVPCSRLYRNVMLRYLIVNKELIIKHQDKGIDFQKFHSCQCIQRNEQINLHNFCKIIIILKPDDIHHSNYRHIMRSHFRNQGTQFYFVHWNLISFTFSIADIITVMQRIMHALYFYTRLRHSTWQKTEILDFFKFSDLCMSLLHTTK